MTGNPWRRRRHLCGALVLLALTLAACGNSATPTATTGTSGGAASAAPASAAPASAAPASAAPSAAGAAGASAAPSAAPSAVRATATAGGPVATAPRASATATSGAARYAITPGTSKATYKVGEIFFNQGNRYNLAEGTTSDITGDLFIDKTNPSASRVGQIRVDISKLESDSEQRDTQIQNRWLESKKFPIATFVGKRVEGLPTGPYKDGDELTFKIVGDLTVRNVTREVTFDAKGKVVGDLFTGTATTKFKMTDFGFDPPSIIGILKAEDDVELVMELEAKRAS
jgi:polyisoprenoid-binding protein YceI